MLAAAGDNSGTESQWREAIALLPQAVEPRLKLAQLLGQLGRLPEAEKQWREVLRLDPNNADAQAQLSTLHQSRL